MISYFNRLKAKKGFTLAELIIVIAIIGVLIAITVPALFTNNVPTKAKAIAKDLFYTTQDLMSTAKIASLYEIPSDGACFYAKVSVAGSVEETGIVSDYLNEPVLVSNTSVQAAKTYTNEFKALVDKFDDICSSYLVDTVLNGTILVVVDGSYRTQVAYWTDAPMSVFKDTPQFVDDYLIDGYYSCSYPVNNSLAGAEMFVA